MESAGPTVGTNGKFVIAGIVPAAPWENDSGRVNDNAGDYIPAECELCG